MSRTRAAAGSFVFLLLVPGVVAGAVPWAISGWEVDDDLAALPLQVLGAVLIAAGTLALLYAFTSFALEGMGTPAPVAPTRRLVVGGLYRYVRNPMYVAVAAIIAGQALVFASLALVAYAGAFMLAVAAFVHLYEEPTLSREYGGQYAAYRSAVPGWRPRLRPWTPDVP